MKITDKFRQGIADAIADATVDIFKELEDNEEFLDFVDEQLKEALQKNKSLSLWPGKDKSLELHAYWLHSEDVSANFNINDALDEILTDDHKDDQRIVRMRIILERIEEMAAKIRAFLDDQDSR